jgi:hypothetical protein
MLVAKSRLGTGWFPDDFVRLENGFVGTSRG